MEGERERRGCRRGTFLGVTRIVMERPRRERMWARSRRGFMWPAAGKGKTRMCAAVENMFREITRETAMMTDEHEIYHSEERGGYLDTIRIW